MDMDSDSDAHASIRQFLDLSGLPAVDILLADITMEEDQISTPGSPVEVSGATPGMPEQTAYEKQLASLQTYIDSVPYECETVEEMTEKLAHIVDKLYICASACLWNLIPGWNDVLLSWLQLRYPMQKSVRVKLLKFYYDLCLVPGLPLNVVRSGVTMFSQILSSKRGPSHLRLVDPKDLVLDWQSLWRVLRKEVWPWKRLYEPSRNKVNLLLFLAERSKYYYPATEISRMLDTFIPILTKDTVLTIVPILTSFLPMKGVDQYLPALFTIFESVNSHVVEGRIIETLGDIAEEYAAGVEDGAGEEALLWRDVGIWSEDQWVFLMGKCLGTMGVPVGSPKGANTTAALADAMSDKRHSNIKKTINIHHPFAKLIVYSMSVDGPMLSESSQSDRSNMIGEEGQTTSTGYLAGSKALDSLAKLITSTETFFHPSNTGMWTINLANFLHRLAAEFCKRWKEEQEPKCKTPITHRLTHTIRRSFILTLRTPALLALFAKDPISMGLAQGAVRIMAMLEPDIIMPQLLERAYGGLEVVNETHRTTAVLSMLSGVPIPLVSERLWRGGQKHLVPLLELCLPGIDLNDPSKTICATMFICAVAQHVKFGDLSIHAASAGVIYAEDGMSMDVDAGEIHLPGGIDHASIGFPVYSREEERALARESTAGFADWLVALFRRVFALYENLPEEGGKRNMTGGKQEESVLKSIKNTLDVICLHLSDPLFDLVLKVVFDYATTNTKSNAVRAFGQLISCLARVKPRETLDKFLPFCASRIKEELQHGASSVRTTSTHAASPSDTTLHWNLAILRGCVGYGGPALVGHKDMILDLVDVLIDKTKSERGFSSTGRLISRLLHTLSGVYPLNSRFVNTDEWDTEEFDRNHNLQWGRLYHPSDIKIEWHVPGHEEVSFILDILDRVADPLVARLTSLLETTSMWDSAARNDFCRYLYALRSVWSGLPTLIQEETVPIPDPTMSDSDMAEFIPTNFLANAGFTLTDPQDPRYQTVLKHKTSFGHLIHMAAMSLRGNEGGEDHIDAIIGVAKAIEIYLVEYAVSQSSYASLAKNYSLAREANRMWPRQKENSRLVFLKRAQVYHSARLSVHGGNRRRSHADVQLFEDLLDLSLSPYTRLRRYGQSALFAVCNHFRLARPSLFPVLLSALSKGSDPDRMKGALYVLASKDVSSITRTDRDMLKGTLVTLLECQHQEKPSVQKLVATVLSDLVSNNVNEEYLRSADSFELGQDFQVTLHQMREEFPVSVENTRSADRAKVAAKEQSKRDENAYNAMVIAITDLARRSATHWRYLQMAVKSVIALLRRDVPPSPAVAELLSEVTTKSHPATRTLAQRGLAKLLAFVKVRSYSKNRTEAWLQEWSHPLHRTFRISNTSDFVSSLAEPFVDKDGGNDSKVFIDKLRTGFIVWSPSIKAYGAPGDASSLSGVWEQSSLPALSAVNNIVCADSYFTTLATLWSQETETKSSELTLRPDNVLYMKTLAKMFEDNHVATWLSVIDPLLSDSDRFKQRAGAELLAGILRGSKHWIKSARERLYAWFMARIDGIFSQIKPDTITFWEYFFKVQFQNLDPRRNQPLINWLLALPLDFQSDSAFTTIKSLILFSTMADTMGIRLDGISGKYIDLFLDNAGTDYAEIRANLSTNLTLLMSAEWNPWYPSVEAFITACRIDVDPLKIRQPKHLTHIEAFVKDLPGWKAERFPPPRVNQSQYDKVSLSLLAWFWTSGHGPNASSIFPYIIPLLPEILKMTELNDNPDLQMYSSAVLYVMSAVTPPKEYVQLVADSLITTIKTSSSWKIKLNGLPVLIVFFYKNLISFSREDALVGRLMDVVIACLSDENVEVREMAAKVLSGLLRCSQRRSILPLRNRFVADVKKHKLPSRQAPGYAESSRALHSAILGICALVESFPYSVEPWMPPLTEVLAPHASDPPPISTTIRKCASEFKKTHQDSWHTDQQAFDEDQLQSLSSMLIGTSYYA